MCPKSEAIALIQKRLGNEVVLGTVQGDRLSVVDLNRIGTTLWSNRPIYLYGGTCLVIRERGS